MKVIFLDFDGVLNSEQFVRMRRGVDKSWRGLTQGPHSEFCAIAVSNLAYILKVVPDAKIVISSSWRVGVSLEDLKRTLKRLAGVDPSRVIDKTPKLNTFRGHEIQQWLDDHHEVTTFVILDDNDDMVHLTPRLIRTSWAHGLLLEDAKRAARWLTHTRLGQELDED